MKREKKKLILRYLLVSCLVLGFFAQNAISHGRFIVKPSIETGVKLNSNFHKSDANEKKVYTYNVKPGIELGYLTDKSRISLDYSINILKYDDQDSYLPGETTAEDKDYEEHKALFNATTQATEHLFFGVNNRFMVTQDAANADEMSNSVDRFEYTLNDFSPNVLYNFGDKFGVGLKYNNLILNYKDDADGEGEDSVENRGTLAFYYYLTSKTSFDLNTQYWKRDYDKNSVDYDSTQVMLNVKHQINYFTFGAGAGYHVRNFDKKINGQDDIDQFAWKLSVLGQNPPDTTGTPKSSMYLSLGSNFNNSGAGNSYYNSTRLDARLTYLLVEKINCTLKGFLQNSDYEFTDRDDDKWGVSLGADYLFNDRLSIGLLGGVEERDSNKAGKDYDDNYVAVNIRYNFDFGSR